MRWHVQASILAWCANLIYANVEKVVFLGPQATHNLDQRPGLDELDLVVINSSHRIIRTHLSASFPTSENPQGAEAWFLIEGLFEHQRYEVRLCWSATVFPSFLNHKHSFQSLICVQQNQSMYRRHVPCLPIHRQQPTSFKLDTHTLLHVFDTPELIKSLADYSESRWAHTENSQSSPLQGSQSLLFLQVTAAAEYYSTNESLMQNVPPVKVDLSAYHIT